MIAKKSIMMAASIGLVLVLALAGCNSASSPSNTITSGAPATATASAGTPAALPPAGGAGSSAATGTPVGSETSAPGAVTVTQLTNNCNLLNSHDLATPLITAETQKPILKTAQVSHLAFSDESVPATETSCLYLTFHRPGHTDGYMLQVTYWVDISTGAAPQAWAKVWADAKSQAGQAVSGIGDDAFYHDGRLMVKKGEYYFTIEVIGDKLNTDTSAGVTQQKDYEKTYALDAIGRIP